MILEVATLDIKRGREAEFESAFAQAKAIIASAQGYISHELHHCVEQKNRYVLLVRWQTLDHHTVGFRNSPAYQEWKKLLHHLFDPYPPVVQHFERLNLDPAVDRLLGLEEADGY